MATYYVWSGAVGAGTGADWANAYTKIVPAITFKNPGDIFFVAHDHAETTVGPLDVYIGTGSLAAPSWIICVDRFGAVPPTTADLRTTATITTTGSGNITFGGYGLYAYGLNFICSVGATGTNSWQVGADTKLYLRKCTMKMASTGASARHSMGSNATHVVLDDCRVEFAVATQGMHWLGDFIWRNTANPLMGSVIPNTIHTSLGSSRQTIEGVDFSAFTNTSMLGNTSGSSLLLSYKNCKFNAGATLQAVGAPEVSLDFLDTGSTPSDLKNNAHYAYAGTEVKELTVVPAGRSFSRKVTTISDCSRVVSYEALPLVVWNDVVGSPITLTMEGAGAVLPDNGQVWFDVDYGGPQIMSGGFKPLVPTVPLAASDLVWAGSPAVRFKQSHTITPEDEGWIYVYPRIAMASSTVYLDPVVTVS